MRIVCALCAVTLACARPPGAAPDPGTSPQPGSPESAGEPIDRALEEALASHATAPPAQQRPDPLLAPAPDVERFNVSANKVPARQFLLNLVADTPYNMVIDPKLTGQITLELKNATTTEVLAALRDLYGYEFQATPYGFYVMAAGLQTRVFEVDYLNVRRKGESQLRVNSGEVTESGSGEGGGGSATIGSSLSTQSDTDFWSDLIVALRTIVGTGKGRSVVASPNSGLVVVRAMPAEQRDVERFLARVTHNLSRQVVIDAKILEITLSDGFQSGINWSYLAEDRDGRIIGGQTGGGSTGSSGLSEIIGNTGDLSPLAPTVINNTETSAFGGVFSAVIDMDRIQGFVEFLESQGEVRTLSAPRVSTLNNQKAVIKVGTDEFFVTDISTTTIASTATTTTPDVTLTPFFSGIALDVTPQISGDNEIVLHIHPSISQVKDQTKVVSVGGVDQTLPLALSTIRESDSVVRMRSGQVIVLGGLMQDNVDQDQFGTPFLRRIPILGWLFRQEKDALSKNELVILLQARVVGEETWRELLDGTRRRMRQMKREEPNPLQPPPAMRRAGSS